MVKNDELSLEINPHQTFAEAFLDKAQSNGWSIYQTRLEMEVQLKGKRNPTSEDWHFLLAGAHNRGLLDDEMSSLVVSTIRSVLRSSIRSDAPLKKGLEEIADKDADASLVLSHWKSLENLLGITESDSADTYSKKSIVLADGSRRNLFMGNGMVPFEIQDDEIGRWGKGIDW